ncbi:MAG TPA: response regulator [Bryobacteraceae bacterium]|nr:response regulator [Bryobacteraceae bacterium]
MNTGKASADTGRSFNGDYSTGAGPCRAIVSVCNHRTLGFDQDSTKVPQFTILIAGCKAQDLHRFRRALESTKLVVDVQMHMASDGGTALDDVLAGVYPKPNLILLDCETRGEFSLEIVRALKGNSKTRNIPLIALAQPGDDLYVEDLYRCQANCVLPKPQTVEGATALFTRIEQFWFRVAALPVLR